VRYIRSSEGCSLDEWKEHYDAGKLEVERLARKHRVAVEALQPVGLTIERLKQKGVQIPEQHSCQDGVLWPGSYHANQRRAKEVPDGRPSWIVEAEKKLTKYPYSLLFSLIRLVAEPRAGDPFDGCVPLTNENPTTRHFFPDSTVRPNGRKVDGRGHHGQANTRRYRPVESPLLHYKCLRR
jgi:hypothetical protein